MNSLLKLATEAHGGVDHWNHLESLKAHLSVTGVLWHAKGRPDVLNDIRIELPLQSPARSEPGPIDSDFLKLCSPPA